MLPPGAGVRFYPASGTVHAFQSREGKMKKIICMILAFAFASLIAISCSKPSEDIRIVFFMGSAEVTHSDGITEPISLKMFIRKDDRINTKEGHVLLQIGDEVLTRIESGTTVEVAKLFDNNETQLALHQGQLISKVKKLEKNSFTIKTPTAVASVRGTAYSVSYYENRSVVAVKEGRVQVDSTVNKQERHNMINAGNTMVINKGLIRSINEFESLDIDKLSAIPYSSKGDLEDDASYKNIAGTAEKQEDDINKQILSKGGPIPKTLDEMLIKFGYLNRLTLYNNKSYTGIILSRGANEVKLMTLDGIETVPARQVKNLKRTRSTVE